MRFRFRDIRPQKLISLRGTAALASTAVLAVCVSGGVALASGVVLYLLGAPRAPAVALSVVPGSVSGFVVFE